MYEQDEKISQTIRRLALFGFVGVIGTFSWILWLLPMQILFEEFHSKYLSVSGDHLSAWLIITWFMWGAYKTAGLMFNDQNEAYHQSVIYRVKVWALIPLAPLMDLRLPKDPFNLNEER